MGATWYRGFPSDSKNANPLAFAAPPGARGALRAVVLRVVVHRTESKLRAGASRDVDAACAGVARASRSPSFVVFVASASGMAAAEFARAARALDGRLEMTTTLRRRRTRFARARREVERDARTRETRDAF